APAQQSSAAVHGPGFRLVDPVDTGDPSSHDTGFRALHPARRADGSAAGSSSLPADSAARGLSAMPRPLILFFNPFFATFPDVGRLACRQARDFTQDRARMAEADAIVIHLPSCERI